MPGGFRETVRDQQEETFGLLSGRDGILLQRALGVQAGEPFGECVARFALGVEDVVFREAGDDAGAGATPLTRMSDASSAVSSPTRADSCLGAMERSARAREGG